MEGGIIASIIYGGGCISLECKEFKPAMSHVDWGLEASGDRGLVSHVKEACMMGS